MTARETLTPRQRVHAALDHREPDRVPIDFGGFQTGIHRWPMPTWCATSATTSRRAHPRPHPAACGAVGEGARALPCGHALRRRARARRLRRLHRQAYAGGREWLDLTDEFGVTWSMPDDEGLYMDISHHPLADATLADLDDYPWPNGADPSRFTACGAGAGAAQQHPLRPLLDHLRRDIRDCWYMRGLEQWFVEHARAAGVLRGPARPRIALLGGLANRLFGRVGRPAGRGDDRRRPGGTGRAAVLARVLPAVVRPRQRRVVDTIKRHTRARVWFHTCGGCAEYIPDLIGNGVDALNPVQISARGMEPERLKRQFGDKLAFWAEA